MDDEASARNGVIEMNTRHVICKGCGSLVELSDVAAHAQDIFNRILDRRGRARIRDNEIAECDICKVPA